MNIGALLQAICAAGKSKEIIVLGDAMLDTYVDGSVDRVSPEAPVPVLKYARERTIPGGAANVARNVTALGVSAHLISVVGDDATASTLADSLAEDPLLSVHLHKSPRRTTTLKQRFVAERHQLMRLDREDTRALTVDEEDAVLDLVATRSTGCAVAIISDYAKGVLTDRVLREAILTLREANVPVLVDPKSRDFSRYAGAWVITPNRREAEAAFGVTLACDDDIADFRSVFDSQSLFENLLITRGSQGMTLFRRGEEMRHFRAQAREVFDVSGAGDTAVATLAVAIASGGPLPSAVALSNLAAAVSVEKFGTATITTDELEHLLERHHFRVPQSKLASLDTARAQAERWRDKDLVIGFTNGCFDLIHPGHIALLRQSKESCDRLIVGLNSDRSVRRLKGPERPYQDETARAAVLTALAVVDGVVIFDEDTPLNIINALKPDVLIKGGDYEMDTIVGAKEVRSWGGRVIRTDFLDGHSTTKISNKFSQE